MKICPLCESGYHDSHATCPTHGGLLSEIRDLKPGMLIRGTYRIVKKLGKGGMGSVYLAHHTLMDEPRALKFLSQELGEDESFTTRFLREVRTLRQVRNKNVVDCGDPERAEDDSLFFSMEFVEGPTLRDFLKTAPRPFDVALALDITHGIAEGLGGAHSKGIIHRDIKPENILMAREDGQWVPKIVDFGIVATKETSQQTRTGSMLLTMAYAAPEQWIGTRAADLDGRTDLYALGGVLFEMLVGHTVFEAENYHGWAQKHLNAPPAAPSTYRHDLAQWRGLDNLVLSLLAKDVNQRPQNVAELLTLLSAIVYDPNATQPLPDGNAATAFYEAPKPRPAFPPSGLEPLSHTSFPSQPAPPAMPPEAAATLAMPAPAAGNGASQSAAATSSRAPAEERDAPAYPTMGRPVSLPTETRRTGANQTAARTTSRHDLGSPTSDPVHERTRSVPIWLWLAVLVVLVALGFEAKNLYKPQTKFETLRSQSDSILSVAFSPSGQTLASAAHDNTIQFWDMTTRKPLNEVQDHVDAITFSPGGSSIASADWDKNVQLWSVSTGQVLATMDGHTDRVLCVAFSPDGHTLATGSADKTIRLWDVASGKTLRILKGHAGDVRAVAFSPDGRTLASGSADATVKLWDVSTGKLLFSLTGHSNGVNAVAFSPDGHTLASGSSDNTIILWDVATGKAIRTLTGHTDAVRSVAFSPDGTILASGSDDDTIKLWNVASGTAPYATLKGTAGVNSIAFNQDGTLLASGNADSTIRLWDMTTVHK
ncbi:MAG: protein kinase domain-containing protein [Terracidiphilus sp.]